MVPSPTVIAKVAALILPAVKFVKSPPALIAKAPATSIAPF